MTMIVYYRPMKNISMIVKKEMYKLRVLVGVIELVKDAYEFSRSVGDKTSLDVLIFNGRNQERI